MKLTLLLIVLNFANSFASAYSQKVSLDIKNAKFSDVIKEITDQTHVEFAYSKEVVDMNRLVSISVTNTDLKTVLDKLLDGTQLLHIELNGKVYLGPKAIETLLEATINSFQQQKVTGTVTDATTGGPLPGVNILFKGTTIGVTTDLNGKYSIDVSGSNAILIFSYVGYLSEEIPVSGQLNIDMKLTPDIQKLDEVVVVGYGTQTKKDILGSVAVVDMKSLKSVPVSSAELALQGQASGVNVLSSGVPGGQSSITIRGISSFGNNSPLVIIDGIQSSLHDINPNDIESVQVLKDAGAASIYGVRGSNGVILITTKKGRNGAPKFTYDGYYGIQAPPSGNVFNLMNTTEYADMAINMKSTTTLFANGIPDYLYAGYVNGIQVLGAVKTGDPAIDPSKYVYNPSDPGKDYLIQKVNKEGTDWFHEIFKNAPYQSHTLTASGGTKNANYLFSLGYLNQQGTLIKTYLKRYNIRANTQYHIHKHFRIGENLYAFYKQNPSFGNQDQNNAIGYTFRTMVMIPAHDIMGNYGGSWAGPELYGTNPVALMENTRLNKNNTTDVVGNVYAELDVLKHFTIRTNFGGTLDNNYYLYHAFNTYQDKETHNSTNSLNEGASNNYGWTWSNTLSYANIFGKHNIKVIVGSEANSNGGRSVGGGSSNFTSDDPNYLILGNGTENITNYSSGYSETLYSLFGRLDYSFDDQYLLGSTVRRDGSSKFGSDSRYGVFPSFSVGWRISKAAFMNNIAWLDDLKLRGSWGKLGSQNNVSSNNAFTLYNSGYGTSYYDIYGTGNIVQGFYASSFGNPRTGWEEDVITNLGIDATVLKNRLIISAEWYKKSINGLLFPQPLPATVGGASVPIINIGDIENKGVDLTITYHGDPARRFNYNASLNITTYKNTIKNIPDPGYFDAGGSSISSIVRNEVGHPVSAFYGYKIVGLFKDTIDVASSPLQDAAAAGRFKYADINKDGKINDQDRTYIGNPNPKFTYGININATYDQFDFSVLFYGSQGNDVFNYTRYFLDFWPTPSGSKSKTLLDAWTPQHTNTSVPIAEPNSNFSTANVVNSYYIENGSFLKCRLVTLGYALKPKIMYKIGISAMRVYIQGSNLFTITKYKGIDPELMSNQSGSSAAFGIDYGNYPGNQKSYLIGVNLTF